MKVYPQDHTTTWFDHLNHRKLVTEVLLKGGMASVCSSNADPTSERFRNLISDITTATHNEEEAEVIDASEKENRN